MADSVVIELLILSLLLAVNARLFFVTRGQRDAVVLLAPVALFICILVFFAWDVTLLNGAIFILSLFVFFENFHGLWRFFNNLYVDYFHPLLWIASVVNILLVIALGLLVVMFRPVSTNPNLQVQERVLALTGSVQAGLRQRQRVFDSVDVMLLQLKPESNTENWTEQGSRLKDTAGVEYHSSSIPLVLWITDERTTVSRIKPLAMELASLGYEVVVADFNQGFLSSLDTRIDGIFFAERFQEKIAGLARESSIQYGAIIDYFGGRRSLSQRRVLLLGDGYTGQGARASALLNDFIAGTYVISSPKDDNKEAYWIEGFGPVGETAPWVNFLVGKREVMESRDVNYVYIQELAQKIHRSYERVDSIEGTPIAEDL